MQFSPSLTALAPAYNAGLLLSLSLIMALGAQNAHVIRMGLQRQHLLLTVAICMLSDMILISMGVLGLARLGEMSETFKTIMVSGGIVFLVVYGAQAFARFRSPAKDVTGGDAANSAAMTPRQATLTALAFSWLNPHVWLDTVVLMGTASLAWGMPGGTVFGLGAATGSVLWFTGLGLCTLWLGQRLRSARVWQVMDGLVALMMWGTALTLAWGLFTSTSL